MGKTSIEWTDASWNPIVGCTEVSPGCANCYAARLAATRLKNHPDYKGLAVIHEGRYVSKEKPSVNCSHWAADEHKPGSEQVRFLPNRIHEPKESKKARRIFVCDMGDLFHESVKLEWLHQILSVIQKCPQHTFQILTKRAALMKERMEDQSRFFTPWPMPNVWLGVSVENQHFADERIPLLLSTPAAVRFISAEPLLGPLDLSRFLKCDCQLKGNNFSAPEQHAVNCPERRRIDWVICGGESGPNARPMHPEWARFLRDQCQSAGVPFFFKQWGEYLPALQDGAHVMNCGDIPIRMGKKKAGRLLDGREWSEFPK
jgi:protein gp37